MESATFIQFRKASNLYKILCNKFSIQIIDVLSLHKNLNVSQIQSYIQTSQSRTSQQLAKLRKIKVLHTERNKTVVFYKINEERLEELKNLSTLLFQ